MLSTNIAGTKAVAGAPAVGQTVAIGLSAGLGGGVLSVLAVAAFGSIYLCRRYAGSLDEPVSDLEA